MIRCIRSPAYALRLLLFALLVSASRADETATPDWPSLEFIRNLQQRQLHRLAEVYCREQLQLSGSAGPEMAPIVVALLNSLASRAVSQRDLDDMSLWTEADAIANDYQQRWAPSSASYEIELRQQLVRMIHANALLTAAELDPQPQQRREQANLLLRLASRSLKDLNDRATELLRRFIGGSKSRSGARLAASVAANSIRGRPSPPEASGLLPGPFTRPSAFAYGSPTRFFLIGPHHAAVRTVLGKSHFRN